jgi:DnaJ-class molecular chaperone
VTAYAILGLSSTATAVEIKAAYRRLAMEFHPDRNSCATAVGRFHEITAAYEELTRSIHTKKTTTTKRSTPQTTWEIAISMYSASWGQLVNLGGSVYRLGPGVSDGDTFDVPGGILKVKIATHHEQWERKGLDLYAEHEVREGMATRAILVPNHPIFGSAVFAAAPTMSRDGDVFRIKGFGLACRGKEGDAFITLRVIPNKWSTLRRRIALAFRLPKP